MLLVATMKTTEITPTDFQHLRYGENGPIARITLDRPEKRNALSIALSDELIGAIALVQESTDIKVLVIQEPKRSAPATTSPRCTPGATPTASRAGCSTRRWPTRSKSSTR